jgi:general stress protein 26
LEVHDFEDVTGYPLDADAQEELLRTQNECAFVWGTRDGWPVGVVMSYVWRDGRFWLTSAAHRKRIAAVRRDPRVSIVVTSAGTPLGPNRSATAKGRCAIRDDRPTKDWFYPELSRRLTGDGPGARVFERFLDSPGRLILEVTPETWITYDGRKLARAAFGGGRSRAGPAR